MSNTWYEVLSVVHLLAVLSLSQANLLLLPVAPNDGHLSKLSEGKVKNSVLFSIPIYTILL